MDIEKLKETVLVNLRSVTQSAKGGVPISRLQSDYKQLIGTVIPFPSLGYNNLEQFLAAIPNVVQLKRKSDGQLYVEAVTDATTAHLANLISKQKGATAKSSAASKKYGFRRTAVNKKSATSSATLDEKDKIIEDLRNSLEKERKIIKDFSTQMIHLNALLKLGQDSLILEQEKVKKLDDQLQAFQKNEKRIEQSKENTELYLKTINNLKSKSLEQEDRNRVLSQRVNFLSNVNQSRIKNEKELLQLINNQIGLLQKKQYSDLAISNSLASINSTILKRISTLDDLNVSMESLHEQNGNSTNTSTKDDNNNTYSNILKLYTEQCEKIQNLENQLQQQNRTVKSVDDKFEKRLQKFYSKVNTQSQELANMKYSIAQLTGYFESHILSKQEATVFPNNHGQCLERENDEDSIKENSNRKFLSPIIKTPDPSPIVKWINRFYSSRNMNQ